MSQTSISRPVVIVLMACAVSAGCSRNPDDAKRRYFASAERYAAKGQYKEAIIEYRNAIKQDPQFGDAHYHLAQVYLRSGDLGNAYEEYSRAANLQPENIDAQLKAGSLLLAGGRFTDAKAWAESVLAREPKNVQAHILLGNALAGLNDLNQGITQIQEAIELDPKLGAAYATLGQFYFARGDRRRAEEAFSDAVRIEPRSVDARLALANFYWASDRLPEAEASLSKAVLIDRASVGANRALATFYMSTNRASQAEPYWRVVADQSQDPLGRLALADYYVLVGRPHDAYPILERVAREKEASEFAKIRIASLQFDDGRRPAAMKTVDEILSRQPKNVSALVLKSRFLLADNKLPEALTQAKAAAAAGPTQTAPHYVLGSVYAAQKNYDAAIEAFQEAVKVNPGAVAAEVQLSQLYIIKNDPAEAVKWADRALAGRPNDPGARLVLIRALKAGRQLDRAEAEIKDLLAKFPRQAALHSELGSIELLKGQPETARAAFARALELDSRSTDALEGLTAADAASNKLPAARARVEARLASTPDDPAVMMVAARTYAASNDLGKAESTLKRLIEKQPSNLQAYAMLGQVYLRSGRLEEARQEFERIAGGDPDSVPANTMVAMIFEATGKPAQARARYEAIVAAHPKAAVAANNLAWINLQEGRLDDALRLAQAARDELRHVPEVNDTLGWVYYKRNQPSEAIGPLVQSVEKRPDNPVYRYHLGMAYYKAGEVEKARAELTRAVAAGQKFEGRTEAEETLAAIKRMESPSNR